MLNLYQFILQYTQPIPVVIVYNIDATLFQRLAILTISWTLLCIINSDFLSYHFPIFFLGKTKKSFMPDPAQVSLDQHTDSVAWYHELCSCQRQVRLKIQLVACSGRKSSRAKSELEVIGDRRPQRKQELRLE